MLGKLFLGQSGIRKMQMKNYVNPGNVSLEGLKKTSIRKQKFKVVFSEQ